LSELIKALDATAKMGKRLRKNDVRVLVIDIENSPNIAHVWGLWQQNVSLAQLQLPQEIISFAAKWVGHPEIIFKSNFHDGHEEMIRAAYELVNEADIIIGYNSQGFDMKHLHTEFLDAGYAPPTPYKNVDLLVAVKKAFRFPSNKLDYVVQRLGIGAKVAHIGHELWVKCMAGDAKAWAMMKKYNIGDIKVTEKLYFSVLPWIEKHPHMGMYLPLDNGESMCPNCGSTSLTPLVKSTKANVSTYQTYRCNECSAPLRSTFRARVPDRLFTAKVRISG